MERGCIKYAARYEDSKARRNSNVRNHASWEDNEDGYTEVRPTIVISSDFNITRIKFRTHPYDIKKGAVKPKSAYFMRESGNDLVEVHAGKSKG